MYSYLKRRKQGVKINDTESFFQILLSGITQSSILGPLLFNIFINDLFLVIKDFEFANFPDDNTVYAARDSIKESINALEKESKSIIGWFKIKDIIVNPDMLQAMIMSCDKKENKYDLNINNSIMSPAYPVTLLDNGIDNKLNFKKYVSTIYKKASR